jgi:protein-S-isoprenylcysteine O-methyltransferase Ste14
MLEPIAHYAALAMVLALPPLPLLWLVIHEFVDVWRRVGAVGTYAVILALYALSAWGLYLISDTLLSVRFGLHPMLALAGGASLLYSFVLRYRIERDFGRARLMGVQEIAGGADDRLVTNGIYARVRHPRYAEGVFIVLGMALLCNYLVLYAMVLLYLVEIFFVVLLEERELKRRFGRAYEEYAAQVPRFIPRRT